MPASSLTEVLERVLKVVRSHDFSRRKAAEAATTGTFKTTSKRFVVKSQAAFLTGFQSSRHAWLRPHPNQKKISLDFHTKGVDMALEVVGLPETMRQAMLPLAVLGRAVLARLTEQPCEVYPYTELLGKEAEVIGSSDYLFSELLSLLEFVRRGMLDLSDVIMHTV